MNKPIYFFSPDGKTWNGSPEPYRARQKDIVKMEGYEGYELGDLNGANVLLHDQGKFFLYFSNWKDKGKVYLGKRRHADVFPVRRDLARNHSCPE